MIVDRGPISLGPENSGIPSFQSVSWLLLYKPCHKLPGGNFKASTILRIVAFSCSIADSTIVHTIHSSIIDEGRDRETISCNACAHTKDRKCCVNPASWLPLAVSSSFTQPLGEKYGHQRTNVERKILFRLTDIWPLANNGLISRNGVDPE